MLHFLDGNLRVVAKCKGGGVAEAQRATCAGPTPACRAIVVIANVSYDQKSNADICNKATQTDDVANRLSVRPDTQRPKGIGPAPLEIRIGSRRRPRTTKRGPMTRTDLYSGGSHSNTGLRVVASRFLFIQQQ